MLARSSLAYLFTLLWCSAIQIVPIATAPAGASAATTKAVAPRSPSSTPHFMVYSNKRASTQNALPDVNDIKGFNVLCVTVQLTHDIRTDFSQFCCSALAFYTNSPLGQASTWASLSTSDRQAAKQAYNDAGISVIVSVFGDSIQPTTSGYDPTDLANDIASFVTQYDLDGVDGK